MKIKENEDIEVSGIYRIVNTVNGKVYVGSSENCKRRFKEHLNNLLKGYHPNLHLQRAWNVSGGDSFQFEILEKVAKEDLIHTEQKYIDSSGCTDRNKGYNLTAIAGKVEWTSELRKKVSDSKKGKPSKFKGIKRSPEVCLRISEAKKAKGLKYSEDSKQKMRDAYYRNEEVRLSHLEKIWKSRRTDNSR